MDVETLSVAAVDKVIALCPGLTSYIARNDKTPFTDGHIEVYSGEVKKNKTRVGRVHVQVKGRAVRTRTGRKRTWPVERENLLAYMKDSGVLYFVVDVEEVTGECEIYYALLSPFKIRALLETHGKGGKVPAPIKLLPREPNKVEAIVRLSLETRDQHPEGGFDSILLSNAEAITITSPAVLDFEAPLKLDPAIDDVTVSLHTTGGMTIQPPAVLEILPADYARRPLDFSIAAGGTTYDQGSRQRIDGATVEIALPDGVTLTLTELADRREVNFNYRLQGSLASRLRAVRFMHGVDTTQTVELNGKPTHLGALTRRDPSSSLVDALRELKAWSDFFETLHADTELIDPGEISEQEHQQLLGFRRAIVHGDELSGTAPGTGFMFQPVGRWGLVMLVAPGAAEGRWKMRDPFTPEYARRLWARSDSHPEPYPVTPYEFVQDSENLHRMLNLKLDSLVAAYEAIADFPITTYPRANQMVLALVRAADADSVRRAEFLDAAGRLNHWLIEEEGPQVRHRINGWQIAYRNGTLSEEDRGEVRALKHEMARNETADQALQAQICCAILLDDPGDRDFLAARLTTEELAEMKAWPIWTLTMSEPST